MLQRLATRSVPSHAVPPRAVLIIERDVIQETQLGLAWSDALEMIWTGERKAPLWVIELDLARGTVEDLTLEAVKDLATRTVEEGFTPGCMDRFFDDVWARETTRHGRLAKAPSFRARSARRRASPRFGREPRRDPVHAADLRARGNRRTDAGVRPGHHGTRMVGIAFGLLLLGPVARIEQARLVHHHPEIMLRGELP